MTDADKANSPAQPESLRHNQQQDSLAFTKTEIKHSSFILNRKGPSPL